MSEERPKITKDRAEGPIYRSLKVRADGHKIKRLREERGISVAEFSERSGVSTSAIYALQKGPKGRTWAERNYTLKRLADVLGVEVGELEA